MCILIDDGKSETINMSGKSSNIILSELMALARKRS